MNAQAGYALMPTVLLIVTTALFALLLNRTSTMQLRLYMADADVGGMNYALEAAIAHTRWTLSASNCSNYQDLPDTGLGNYRYNASVSPTDGSPVTITANASTLDGVQRTRTATVRVFELAIKKLRDEFNAISWAGSDGNANWTADWQETGESQNPSAGRVQVENNAFCALGNCLRIGGDEVDINGRGAFREADLSGAVSAELTFSYRRDLIDAPGGNVTLMVSSDGGGGWTVLATYTLSGQDDAQVPQLFDLTPYIATNTQIRFRGNSNFVESKIFFDNIQIEAIYPSSGTSATLDPGNAVDDATIDMKEPTKNYGATAKIIVGAKGLETSNALVRFDLSSLPSGSVVQSATLSLYLDGVSENPAGSEFSVHRVLSDWAEGTLTGAEPADGATWNTYDGSNNWTTAGGDHDPAALDTLPIGSVAQRYDFYVTEAVRNWVEYGQPNYGVLVQASTNVKMAEFMSGDETDSSKHPRLTVTYACECGVGCTAGGPDTVMLVVPDAANMNSQDLARQTLIESWGYVVQPISDHAEASAFNAAFPATDVAYVSENVSASQLGTKLTNAPIGVVSEESDINDELGISSSFVNFNEDEIDIVDNTHYITQPFGTGVLPILTSVELVHAVSGTPAPDLQTLAVRPGSGSGNLVLVEEGDDLWNVGPALARRTVLPWGRGSFDFNALNTSGQTLMQRALEWGLYKDQAGSNNSVLLASADNRIEEGTSANFGGDPTIAAGRTGSGADQRVLVKFDLSSIPPGATITNATLRLFATQLDATYASVVNAHGPAGYWRLGETETSGPTAVDASGNGLDGTYQNGVLLDQPSGSDDNDPAAEFDGNDDYVDLGTPTFSSNTFTVVAWVRLDTLNGEPHIAAQADGPAASNLVWLLSLSNQRLRFRLRVNSVTHTLDASAGNVSTGIWYHAVATYDGTMMRLYLNGLPVGVQLQPGTIDTNPAASVAIGAHPSLIGPAAHLDGVIDEVAVFDRALSPTEVQVLHQAYTQLDFDIDAHRVTESWTESGSNWDTLDGSTPWASGAGGSYDPAPVTSLAADTTGWYEFDLRTLVQEWIDGINANEGVQLNTTAVANGLQVVFDSREGANVPELNVEYTQ